MKRQNVAQKERSTEYRKEAETEGKKKQHAVGIQRNKEGIKTNEETSINPK